MKDYKFEKSVLPDGTEVVTLVKGEKPDPKLESKKDAPKDKPSETQS